MFKLLSFTPEIDLFASDSNKKLDKFCSWLPCPNTFRVDAFTLSWTKVKGFIFCPFSLIPWTLHKIKEDRAMTICGIWPLWETASWWGTLLGMINGLVWEVNQAGANLFLPWDICLKHLMGSKLCLIFTSLLHAPYKHPIYQKVRLNKLPNFIGANPPKSP